MLIRPQVYADGNGVSDVCKESSITRSYKNEIYVSRIAGLPEPGQTILFDVVVISEIIGDVPGEKTGRIEDSGKIFAKIVHYFSGRLSPEHLNEDPESMFDNMVLHPTISSISSFKDSFIGFGSTQFYNHSKGIFTKFLYRDVKKASLTTSNFNTELEYFREGTKYLTILDIPDPKNPALYKYFEGDVPRLSALNTKYYKGSEFRSLPGVKVKFIYNDFAAEEAHDIDRNNKIRALLGSNAIDDFNENEPLVDRVWLGITARHIAVDFMEADVVGMEESCSLIFDNKKPQITLAQTQIYCGFKSLVSPFGELLPSFDEVKSTYIASTFDKICKVALGVSTPRHYRAYVDCNPYEVTVKLIIMDNLTDPEIVGSNLYNFTNSVTIRMKKSELLDDFVNQHIHKQSVLSEYNK